MSFLEGIGAWILEVILKWLFNLATNAVQNYEDQVAEDKRRGEINDANVKAYEEARDRASRIAAATKLLNRTP